MPTSTPHDAALADMQEFVGRADGTGIAISVVIPTYRRPDDLAACLVGLATQTRAADEIIVVRRQDDTAAAACIAGATIERSRLKEVIVAEPGGVAALNCGLDAATGDVVAFLDDDAVPYPEWLARLEEHYLADPELAGLGGRDHLQGDSSPGRHSVVGRVQWWGRCIGWHHEGTGSAREVDILKGANMSFRRSAIERIGFDRRLRGPGSQVDCDKMLCLRLRKEGRRLVYDPKVAVAHFPGVRHDDDKREWRTPQAQANAAHNRTLTMLTYLPPLRRFVFLLWQFLIGTRDTPGIVQVFRLGLWRSPQGRGFFAGTLSGELAGIGTWISSR